LLALAGLLFSPLARATCQEGCLSNLNTALGDDALLNNTGLANTAIGLDALLNNTIGFSNTAIGADTLVFNTAGNANMASGQNALFRSTIGNDNTASGASALYNNTTGNDNTACGHNALYNNTTGGDNVALGDEAGYNLTTGRNNVDIANHGKAGESGTIRIGNRTHNSTFISGISGVTVASGVGVVIDTDGHLGTLTSSKRYKEAIKPMDRSSEAILDLKPVTFHYKRELDPQAIPQFGLVAEDVARIDPDLVANDDEGKPYTVRYEAVNAMLLNEFLKEHKKVEELEATVAKLQSTVEKVSARVETNQSRSRLVDE